MRTLFTSLFLSSVFCVSMFGATIALWDFNSVSPDSEPATGTLSVTEGIGNLNFFGGATNLFGRVRGGSLSDQNEADGSEMRITRPPPQATKNKGVGLELQVSTRGFENVRMSWDQYNSATASRYWRVMYSTDAVNWIEDTVIIQASAGKWVHHSVNLRDHPALNDCESVHLRIAAEFESTASGAGPDEYRAIAEASQYSTSGSWWVDYLTIRGRIIGVANELPTMSAISAQTVVEGSDSGEIVITISDAETKAESLMVNARFSVPGIITNLAIRGTGMDRTLKFHAVSPGQTQITIAVEDEEGGFVETGFAVTVLPKDSEPLLSPAFVLWNFNSPAPDPDAATGSFEPAAGTGELFALGVSTSALGTVGQGRTSDLAELDNSMLRLAGFPQQGTGNQTAGVEIRASTVGLREIGVFWDQYNSSTASRFWAVQYTVNGLNFIDHAIVTNSTASSWLRQRFVSFSSIAGVEHNPQFGVRIVSAGGPDGAYEAVTSGANYGTTGTLWLDMLGLTGKPTNAIGPSISCVSDDGGFRITWPKTSEIYLIEMREDLGMGWLPVEGTVEELSGILQFTAPLEGNQRFYRLRIRDFE